MAELAVGGLLEAALVKKRPRFARRSVTVTVDDAQVAVGKVNTSDVFRWVDTQISNKYFWDPVLKAIGVTFFLEEPGDDCVKTPKGDKSIKDTLCALIIALSSTVRPSPHDKVLRPFCMVVAPILSAKMNLQLEHTDLYEVASKVASKVNGPDALRYEEIMVQSPGDYEDEESEVVHRHNSISEVLQAVGYDAGTAGPFVANGKTKGNVSTTIPIPDYNMTIGDVMRKGHMSTLCSIVKVTELQVESPSPNSPNVLLTVHPEQNIWDVLNSAGYVGLGLGSQFIAQGQNEDDKPVGVVITKWHTTIRDVMRDGNMRALFSIIRAFRVPLEEAWTYS